MSLQPGRPFTVDGRVNLLSSTKDDMSESAARAIGSIGGVFSLPIAVLAHDISEFVVIGSGLRMLRA